MEAAAPAPPLDDFYKTVAGISFTLLGLWWVVVQLKYKEGAGDPTRRRHAYGVMMYFLLPGVMTLVSAVNSDHLSLLWRIAFGVAAALGLLEIALYWLTPGLKTATATALRWCAFVVYAFILVVAIHPMLPVQVGLGLAPREAEAILVGLLIVVGVNLAWLGLTESGETAGA
ncbi:MAG: hypothetical protein ACJ76S_09720 [Solirubrobacteraceae bacterium]